MKSSIIYLAYEKCLNIFQFLWQKLSHQKHILTKLEKEDMIMAKVIQENDKAENLNLEDAIAYYQTLN